MPQSAGWKTIARAAALRFVLLLLASYGMLYFADRWYAPTEGFADFSAEYYQMYQKPLDFSAAGAPFVYRQASAVLTYVVHATGITYNPSLTNAMARVHPEIDQGIFFAALLTNYLALVAAATIAGRIVERQTGGCVFPLLCGFFCLLSLLSQSVVITGMTEGVSWLFVAGLYALYERGSIVAFGALMLLSIFQREMISIAFALIAGFSLLLAQGRRPYNVRVLVLSMLAFIAYTIIRKYLLPVPGFEGQLTLGYLAENLTSVPALPMRDLILQGLFSQNVMFIAMAAGAVLWVRTQSLPKDLVALVLAFAAIVSIGLAEGINNNVGRIGGLLTPAFAAMAAISLYHLEKASRGAAQSAR